MHAYVNLSSNDPDPPMTSELELQIFKMTMDGSELIILIILGCLHSYINIS